MVCILECLSPCSSMFVNIVLVVCMSVGGDVSEKVASVSFVNCGQSDLL